MAKLQAFKRLARLKIRGFKKPASRSLKDARDVLAVSGIAAVGGAQAGAQAGPPGLRGKGAQEGAFGAGTTAAAATIGTKIVFRRIRGRIIPIRVKAK